MVTEQEKFFQRERQRFLKEEALRGPWVTIFRIEPIRDGLSIFSALIEKGRRSSVLEDAGWDLRYGDGGPSICTTYEKGKPVNEYLRLSHGWIEPLTLHRTFPARDSYVELSEEFRLYHQLFYDAKRNLYLKLHDDGHEEEAAAIDDMTVKVKLHLLSDYLAVRQMDFVLFFEGNYWSKLTLEELEASPSDDFVEEGELIRMEFNVTAPVHLFTGDTKSTSLLRGKLIFPCPTESIPDPSTRPEEVYPEFIVGHDQNGKPIKYTCNPDLLDNNFNKNPGAPHYLTRVHFRREVLQKYYDNPQDFTVGDGIVRRSNVWDMRLDNDLPDRVIAFLGDLGRDLPESERHHWMAQNIPPEGNLSKTAHTRSVRGWFADPDSADLVFRREYERVNSEWEKKRGWFIFLPLRSDDAHLLKTIRIPLKENPAEFDNFALAMTKILIDSLNEAEVSKGITLADGDKGITKLQKYLIAQGGPDPSTWIKFLRNLQDLRLGSAHRKNSKHEEACAAFGIEQGFISAGRIVLTKAVAFLEYLRSL